MNARITYVCILFCFIVFFKTEAFCSQQKEEFSLAQAEDLLRKPEKDTATVRIFLKAYKTFEDREPARAVPFLEKALALSEELSFDFGLMYCYLFYAQNLERQGNYEKALKNCLKGLRIVEQLDSVKMKAAYYTTMGNVHLMLENYNDALKFYQRSNSISIQLGQDDNVIPGYLNIALALTGMGKHKRARKYFNKVLVLTAKREDEFSLRMKANCYYNLGVGYSWQYDFENDSVEEGVLQKAHDFYLKSLELCNQMDHEYLKATLYAVLGSSFNSIGDHKKALDYSNKSLELSKKLNLKDNLRATYYNLSKIETDRNNHEQAFIYFKRHIALRDSIEGLEKNKAISELTAKYNAERQQSKIDLLEKEDRIKELQITQNNYLILSLIVVLVIVIFISIVLIKYYRLRESKKTLELKSQLLRSQMNPHFIFNSLVAIQSCMVEKKNYLAEKYLSSFADLMRSVLENSRQSYILLEKELDFIKSYLQLQKLRYEEKFDYELTIAGDVNGRVTQVPPMILQPFIENAIEHGFSTMQNKGLLIIKIYRTKKELIFEIRDNGIGRKKAERLKAISENFHNHMATKIISERISLFNFSSKNRMLLTVTDLQEASEYPGTKIELKLPFFSIRPDQLLTQRV